MFQLYIFGVVMGLFAAAMPGPINLEVIRRAIARGAKAGAFFGMGAVSADLIYVTSISMGAAAIFQSLPQSAKGAMSLAGAIILLIIGLKALRAKPVPGIVNDPNKPLEESTGDYYGGIIKGYFLGLFLTLTSPTTIAYWLFVSFGAASRINDDDGVPLVGHPALVLTAGVATACTAWIILAVNVAGRFHKRIEPKTYIYIERVAGIGLCVFSAISLFHAVQLFSGNPIHATQDIPSHEHQFLPPAPDRGGSESTSGVLH